MWENNRKKGILITLISVIWLYWKYIYKFSAARTISNPSAAMIPTDTNPIIATLPTIATPDKKTVLNKKDGIPKIMSFINPINGSNGPKAALRVNEPMVWPWKSLIAVKNCINAVAIYNTVLERL